MSAEIEQKRRSVRVLRLLQESCMAYSRGDLAACDAAISQAMEVDADALLIIQGGMIIGEIPNPDKDPLAWDEYVGLNEESLARLEAEETA